MIHSCWNRHLNQTRIIECISLQRKLLPVSKIHLCQAGRIAECIIVNVCHTVRHGKVSKC